MTLRNVIGRTGLTLAAAAVIGVAGLAATPKPANAISPGWAAGIGLGAFALGATLAHPYAYSYPYYAPGYYYPPAPAYYGYPYGYAYPPRQCWDGWRYYAC